MAVSPLFTRSYDALKRDKRLKTVSRQVLRRVKRLFYKGLSVNALKSQNK